MSNEQEKSPKISGKCQKNYQAIKSVISKSGEKAVDGIAEFLDLFPSCYY
jgi:hypothetical protein